MHRTGAQLLRGALVGLAVLIAALALATSKAEARTEDPTSVDGRWYDADGNVWLSDRQLWWDRDIYYWVGGEWLDGQGRPKAGLVTAAAADSSLEALIAQYSWPFDQAWRVVMCESGGRNVQNASGGPYFGPFQMWSGHFGPGEDYWDVPTNVAKAFQLWQGSGWSPWECRP